MLCKVFKKSNHLIWINSLSKECCGQPYMQFSDKYEGWEVVSEDKCYCNDIQASSMPAHRLMLSHQQFKALNLHRITLIPFGDCKLTSFE